MNLTGKHVLVLGLGESGLAMAQWCTRHGASVRVADTRAAPPYLDELRRTTSPTGIPSGHAEFIGGEFDKGLLVGIDLLAISPGLSPGLLVVIHARAQGIPVVGEIELFAQGLRALKQNVPVLAITGTNGKTTTTALTGHLLASTGRSVGVAGNISPAALTALMDFQDRGALPQAWVLELSSFQLETLETLNAAAATVLNISDDHLDRYIDLNDYASAKARIFLASAGNEGVQVLNRQDARVKSMALPGRRIISFGLDAPGTVDAFGLRENRGEAWLVQGDRFLLPVSALPAAGLAGLHNAANALAALALCAAIGIDAVTLLPALRSFHGLPHRVEKVAEIGGVTYYDDSKGTNVGATVAALSGLGCKSVVILGGEGKGQDFSPLKAAVENHARGVVLIGRDGPLIRAALDGCGVPQLNAASMDEAVRAAAARASAGDAVLLSPACASFDMFRNYEHRAAAFKSAVQALAQGGPQ
ncbi:MAG: UDP-N-acetylmuramoyl-L-alanine--D-glutamate ligase [Gammaproteobacteria bacterium]|nr:UDP-N-acetylmuramoyl-L-alanine--D-glutamate ligase [Gammaproteobacteria bacterium]MBU3988188.1 UDP-N-acetylmuramoyl-L-alanine--D-glutamate ligase [Gammaproteobacteria bacterium]MBU4005036.1 UDP-N-acetylmuramoyl-L-alanine--D-glutamate ligase [Gammaproteobacteria bacterium]MBU4020629.1 UDP-N-acetylmuramoyl-L-alanine--D-glutamate ligase [Gammaproteobacteria bacterium]MBU4095705.1 UDP-N-acetylmuramoyl-L-alanine--D-glutamate ligase [Gammaproteobacteria bacterium]